MQTPQPPKHKPAPAFLSSVSLLIAIAMLIAWNGMSCLSKKKEDPLASNLSFTRTLPDSNPILNAQFKGKSLEVIFSPEGEQRPMLMRLYDGEGNLIYTEREPDLSNQNGWTVDISRYLHEEERYQLMIQLDDGAELLTWVAP